MWRFDTLPGEASKEAYATDYYVVPPTCGNYTCREFYIDLGFTTSGQRAFPADEGSHTIWVTVRDFVGNEVSQPYTWTVLGAPTATPTPLPCVTIVSGRDSYVKEENVTDNKGDDDELRIKTQAEKLQRPLLWFDVSSVPVGANVQSATLSLWLADIKNGPAEVRVRSLQEAWTEMGVTWRDRAEGEPWAVPGGTYDGTSIDTVLVNGPKNSWVTWDMMGVIGEWIAGENEGVLLESPVSGERPELKFRSREEGDAEERPRLEVCYYEGPPPTATPTPTDTPTPTPTPTATETPTPGPPTDTPTVTPTATETPELLRVYLPLALKGG